MEIKREESCPKCGELTIVEYGKYGNYYRQVRCECGYIENKKGNREDFDREIVEKLEC